MSTILLVDDEQEMLDLFTEVLEQMNHHVLGARDGCEALSLARTAAPDLVVTDWNMPRMSGLELCHELHADEQLRDIPIILHSSAGNPHAPGVQFVPKSCALEEFEALVSRLLASAYSRQPSAPCSQESCGPPAAPKQNAYLAHESFQMRAEHETEYSASH
ncbi:response regulator [Hyalangium rubrum]|uniref:Response regulator n=1 Tax=Hyalangium rubrum TaxID=3103134 RepID=A0ABU5H5E9_9BACT|nr:response regulator [Hyalangium sp. s54d21]MDY7228089.1 response regulator [Hyalangium sp. s54d21]